MSRRARRLLHRFRRLMAGSRVAFVYHTAYRQAVFGAPMDALRGERILTSLRDGGWIRRRDVVEPRPAAFEHIVRVHGAEYLRELDRPETVSGILGVPLRVEEARLAVECQRLIAGGTILATRLALRNGVTAVHLGGGLHHAGPGRGGGFCIFNDVAIAVARLRARQFLEPVLIVDLDLHDGNGTRAAFRTDPTVHTFSIHNADWDVDDAVASTSIALGTGVDDATFLTALRDALPPVLREVRPGLVVYLAGTDGAADDSLGDWRLTSAGMLERDRFVIEQIRAHDAEVPLVITLGGGYGGSTWRYSARFFGWLISGREVEPPDEVSMAARRATWLETGRAGRGAHGRDWLDWSFGPEDIGGLGAAPPGEPRLFGRYTRRDVLESLERAGIMAQIRARGYAQPELEVVASAGLGPTIRIWGDAAREALLMELRVSRNRRAVPGMQLLWIEWLLLQDPRGAFPPGRPPLPGQATPGLGILADVLGWLVSLCRELGFDGVGLRSSHFHIAVIGRRHLRFLEPEDAAKFEAVSRAVAGLELPTAARAVAEGRVVDRATGEPVRWSEVAMVLPVSDRLRSRLEEESASDSRRGADGELDYHVVD